MKLHFYWQCMRVIFPCSFSPLHYPFSGSFDYEFWLLVSWKIVEQFKFAKLKGCIGGRVGGDWVAALLTYLAIDDLTRWPTKPTQRWAEPRGVGVDFIDFYASLDFCPLANRTPAHRPPPANLYSNVLPPGRHSPVGLVESTLCWTFHFMLPLAIAVYLPPFCVGRLAKCHAISDPTCHIFIYACFGTPEPLNIKIPKTTPPVPPR